MALPLRVRLSDIRILERTDTYGVVDAKKLG
jgi:hypothetical protein